MLRYTNQYLNASTRPQVLNPRQGSKIVPHVPVHARDCPIRLSCMRDMCVISDVLLSRDSQHRSIQRRARVRKEFEGLRDAILMHNAPLHTVGKRRRRDEHQQGLMPWDYADCQQKAAVRNQTARTSCSAAGLALSTRQPNGARADDGCVVT